MKWCYKCETSKSREEFHRCKKSNDGYQYMCRDCRRSHGQTPKAKAWRREYSGRAESKALAKANREKNKPRIKENALKRKFGMSEFDYQAILSKQRGHCALCLATEESQGKRLAVDHCHETGDNRGLLCQQCNTGLERVETVPAWAVLAVAYLEKHKNSSARTAVV